MFLAEETKSSTLVTPRYNTHSSGKHRAMCASSQGKRISCMSPAVCGGLPCGSLRMQQGGQRSQWPPGDGASTIMTSSTRWRFFTWVITSLVYMSVHGERRWGRCASHIRDVDRSPSCDNMRCCSSMTLFLLLS